MRNLGVSLRPPDSTLKEQNRNYLAHEYFNRDWLPMPFSEVADLLGQAKLEFAMSANLLEQIDQITLSADGQKLVAPIANTVLRESVRDYLMNAQFRKDVFVKGVSRLYPMEQLERYRAQGFVLTTPAADVPMKLKGPVGEFNLNADIYGPIIAALAEKEYAPKTVAELQAHPAGKDKPIGQILQALIILTGAGHAHPVQHSDAIKAARSRCKALNADLCQRARYSGDITTLASPVIGGGMTLGRFQQLFLLAKMQGRAQPKAWAEYAWQCLNATGQRLLRDGKPIESPEENLAELTRQAQEFEAKQLPILKAVGIA